MNFHIVNSRNSHPLKGQNIPCRGSVKTMPKYYTFKFIMNPIVL